ncbi:MAG: bifunctional nuclease family protein [Acidimicrobiia bacterium]|nr:MAG: bifunctional nuclease family protein [Acidimicrobiia bacterium]
MTPEGIPVELVGVRIELPTNTPIVLLRETGASRYLPIFIGASEATAIALALEGIEPQRPMTHDLLRDVVEALGATVDGVLVTALRDGVFFADLVLRRQAEELRVSSRPSDAIALAARADAPISVASAVLDEAGVEIRDEDEETEVERFRSFLDSVTPEDFDRNQ